MEEQKYQCTKCTLTAAIKGITCGCGGSMEKAPTSASPVKRLVSCRDSFEAYILDRHPEDHIEKAPNGSYHYHQIENMWVGWEACWELKNS